MIALINYGSGNIHAIGNIYKKLNIPYLITADYKELKKADKLILPGVGDFDETMKLFHQTGLKSIMDDLVLGEKKPILGVCVGMQVMGISSEEGEQEGLGWIKGEIKKINPSNLTHKPHLPHLGWNTIIPKVESPLFLNINNEKGFYFLHSYYFSCYQQKDVLATTNYGIEYASAVNNENVYGCQFHPEKSHQNGIEIFKNFAQLKCLDPE